MILIISTENDVTTNIICEWLLFFNKNFIRISENQKINSLFYDNITDTFLITIENISFNLAEITSVYYRNGSIYFSKPYNEISPDLYSFFDAEYKMTAEFILYYLQQKNIKIFGNLFKKNINKLIALHIAMNIGLKVPNSLIFTKKKDLLKINHKENYITKSISEMIPLYCNNELFLNYTRNFSFSEITEKNENLIPTLLQNTISKNYEVRIFFFGKKIWAIAIFDSSKNIDVRNMQINQKNYLPYSLNSELKKKIILLSEKIGLNCGTVDFLKKEGDYYFLEVNPLGQFHEVSYYGNYNIEKYIANLI